MKQIHTKYRNIKINETAHSETKPNPENCIVIAAHLSVLMTFQEAPILVYFYAIWMESIP